MEETIETLAVALHHLGEAARRRIAEIDAEHTADGLRRKDDACLARFGGKTRDEPLSDRFDPVLKTRLVHELQRGEAGCDRHRIPRKRPGLVHRPSGAICCMMSRRPPTAPTGKPP